LCNSHNSFVPVTLDLMMDETLAITRLRQGIVWVRAAMSGLRWGVFGLTRSG
jgi:hypothetical protein